MTVPSSQIVIYLPKLALHSTLQKPSLVDALIIMPNSLWAHAKDRLQQACNSITLSQPKITANNTTTTEDKALNLHPCSPHLSASQSSRPSHPGPEPPSYEDSIQELLQTDPLLRRIAHNQLCCPLVRLPDHILVNIMRSSDLESLSSLRHTSRIFMILFSVDPVFETLHLTSDDHQRFCNAARLWAVPRSIIPMHQEAFNLEPRRMCQSCLTLRKGDPLGRALLSNMAFLHCSGCRKSHRQMHFSERMRNATDDDRVCVGYEGHLILCVHSSISLQQAKFDAASGRKSLPCPFLLHNTSRPTCDSNTCPADSRPYVHSYYDEHKNLRIKLSLTSHIEIQILHNGKICPSSLRKEFTRVSSYPDTPLWYSMFSRTAYDEMQAFDPNICDCVDYYQGHSSLQHHHPIRICPAPAVARWQEKAPEGGYVSETGRCAYMRHGYTFDGVGIQLRVDFLRCHGSKKEMLALRKTFDCAIDPNEASSAGWADLVSWASHGTLRDEEHRCLFFCQRQHCVTRWLQTLDVHLRAIEARQTQRGNLVSTPTNVTNERQDSGDEDDNSGHL